MKLLWMHCLMSETFFSLRKSLPGAFFLKALMVESIETYFLLVALSALLIKQWNLYRRLCDPAFLSPQQYSDQFTAFLCKNILHRTSPEWLNPELVPVEWNFEKSVEFLCKLPLRLLSGVSVPHRQHRGKRGECWGSCGAWSWAAPACGVLPGTTLITALF